MCIVGVWMKCGRVRVSIILCLHVRLIRGIGLHSFPVPLHRIELNSGFVNSKVTIAVRPSLPVDGIDLIMGNNLGHDCVFPCQSLPPPVVSTGVLLSPETDKCLEDFPEVFTACAVTRAMAHAQVEKPSDVSGTLSKLFIPDLPAPLSVDQVIDAQVLMPCHAYLAHRRHDIGETDTVGSI